MSQLEIRDLHVSIDGKEILQGVNLTAKQGEIHAIMGPNGTGKSTLAYTLDGTSVVHCDEGEVHLQGPECAWSLSRTNAPGWGSFWRFSTRLPSPA